MHGSKRLNAVKKVWKETKQTKRRFNIEIWIVSSALPQVGVPT